MPPREQLGVGVKSAFVDSQTIGVIQIRLNGEVITLPPCTIVQLLERQGWRDKRVAVERNGAIVPRSCHASTPVVEGDSLEIVVAVGGG